jgi:hypothetical protein
MQHIDIKSNIIKNKKTIVKLKKGDLTILSKKILISYLILILEK